MVNWKNSLFLLFTIGVLWGCGITDVMKLKKGDLFFAIIEKGIHINIKNHSQIV